jgi:dihydrodipicolinate synthase/N-acetylneuraminate lyase
MNPTESVSSARSRLLGALFPEGVPVLWCPLITHYDRDGSPDAQRMSAHLAHLSPWVKGFLIPGSTGDGWELNLAEFRHVVETALDQATRLKFHLLIGALKTDAEAAQEAMLEALHWLKSCSGIADSQTLFAKRRVCGFTVCPARGSGLSQAEIAQGLAAILDEALPVALYQLPQVTQNEMSPELVAELAASYSNFILFKDSSGADRVALSGHRMENVSLLRGAESDYFRWLKGAGGPYDGFLLSSANCFGRELHHLTRDAAAGRDDDARRLSDRLTSAVNEVFDIVTGLSHGNPFANANKAMDHFFAYGPRANKVPPPRLHAGPCLPEEVIQGAGDALTRCGLMPEKGYLE